MMGDNSYRRSIFVCPDHPSTVPTPVYEVKYVREIGIHVKSTEAPNHIICSECWKRLGKEHLQKVKFCPYDPPTRMRKTNSKHIYSGYKSVGEFGRQIGDQFLSRF